MSREIFAVVVIIAAWSSGTWLLYAWAGRSGSWLQRLDGGRVKQGGNVYGVLGFYSVAMGVALGVVVHQFAIGLSLGFVVGLTLGRKLTRRIVAAQRGPSVPPSNRGIPGARRGVAARPFVLLYGVCSTSVIITCLWLYYGEGMRAWITVFAGAVGLGYVTVLVRYLRSRWKRKNRQASPGPAGGADTQ